MYATWDRSTATVAIVVDGTEEDTTEDAASYVNTPNLPTFSARLPGSSWCTELAAWDTVLTEGGGGGGIPVTSDLVMWFDATAGVTSDGSGNVTEWADQSGNGRDVAQANTALSPNDGRATMNSLTVIDFDGTERMLGAANYAMSGARCALFAVARLDTSSGNRMLFEIGQAGGLASLFMWHNASASEMWCGYADGGGVFRDYKASFSGLVGTDALISFIVRAAAIEIRINGASITNTGRTGYPRTTSYPVHVGIDRNLTSPWDGKAAEIALYDGLSGDMSSTDVGECGQGDHVGGRPTP